jgi:hypothetical protein
VGKHYDTLAEAFWSRVDKRGPDECWPWVGPLDANGYGCFTLDGEPLLAHRVSFVIHYRRDPLPLARHTCHWTRCVNPRHLLEGDWIANYHDSAALIRATRPRGTQHWKAKLTDDEVRTIRRRRADGETLVVIAADFGVSFALVSHIARRRIWTHVE